MSSGLDAILSIGGEEKLNDNRDFNCLVFLHAQFFYWFELILFLEQFNFLVVDCRFLRRRLIGWEHPSSCQLNACIQVTTAAKPLNSAQDALQ
jgi:hypothetical protein